MSDPIRTSSAELVQDLGTRAAEALRPGEAPPPVDLARVLRRLGRLPLVKSPTAYVLRAALGEAAATGGMPAFRALGTRLPIGPRSFAIVGRHHAADVCLPADPTIALRHLLVRAVTTDHGRIRVEVRGLGDGRGAVVVPGGEERGVHVARAAVFAVGGYALIALPVNDGIGDPPIPAHLPAALREPLGPAFVAPPTPMSVEGGGLVHPGPFTSSHIEAIRTSAEESVGRIVLSRGDDHVHIFVSAAELRVGVLIGRYADRCLGGRGAHLFDETVSRTHALLVGDPTCPVVYDLASLNGMYRNGVRVRVAHLVRRQSVRLASEHGVRLEWR